MTKLVETDDITEEIEYCDLVAEKKVIDEIFERIKKLEQATGAAPTIPANPPRENRFKRNAYWVVPVLTLVLGSGAGFGFISWAFNDRVGHLIQEQTKQPFAEINSRGEQQGKQLANIEGRMQEVSDLLKIIAQNEMKRVNNLSPRDFGNSLPAVKTVLAVAKTEHVQAPSEEIIGGIKVKLNATDPNQPGFWGAAAALVNFISMDAAPNLPDCLAAAPVGEGLNATIGSKEITHGPLVYSNCKIELDDPRAASTYAPYLTFASLEFRNCLIQYRGRPIVFQLAPSARILGKLVFKNCVYDIAPPSSPPPATGKKLIETLLAAPDLNSVTVEPQREAA